MGTRADFYVGKDEDAEWIGSIAWDGYRDGIPQTILSAKDAEVFRHEVVEFLRTRQDASFPEEGWPWPWNTSSTTDCSYWFFDGEVWDDFDCGYLSCAVNQSEALNQSLPQIVYPDMANMNRKPLFGPHSGVIVISPSGEM